MLRGKLLSTILATAVIGFSALELKAQSATDPVAQYRAQRTSALHTAATQGTQSCSQVDFDVYPWDPRLPFTGASMAKLVPSWIDADTGIESHRLLDLRAWLPDEVDNPDQDRKNFCDQMIANPQVVQNPDGSANIYNYCDPQLSDARVGDSICLIERLTDGRHKRHFTPLLSYPPAEGNWLTTGGMGVGMGVARLPASTVAGYQFMALVGIGQPYVQDYYGWAVSKDGIDWYFEGKDGKPTKNPQEARPFINAKQGGWRDLHPVMLYGTDNNLYMWFGQTSIGEGSGGIVTYNARMSVDVSKPFGHGEGDFMELWYNGPQSTGYNPAGSWIKFSGQMNDEERTQLPHYAIWDIVDPMAITPLFKPDGKPAGFVMTYDSLNAYGTPHISFRVALNQQYPFEWGPRGLLDIQKVMARGYMLCTAGGISTSFSLENNELYAYMTVADTPCDTREDSEFDCERQPGGLKRGKVILQRPNSSELTYEVFPNTRTLDQVSPGDRETRIVKPH